MQEDLRGDRIGRFQDVAEFVVDPEGPFANPGGWITVVSGHWAAKDGFAVADLDLDRLRTMRRTYKWLFRMMLINTLVWAVGQAITRSKTSSDLTADDVELYSFWNGRSLFLVPLRCGG